MEKEKLSNLLDCIYELEGLVHLALARDDNPVGLGGLIAGKAAAIAEFSAELTDTSVPAPVKPLDSEPTAPVAAEPDTTTEKSEPEDAADEIVAPAEMPVQEDNLIDETVTTVLDDVASGEEYEGEEDTLYVAPDDEDEEEGEEEDLEEEEDDSTEYMPEDDEEDSAEDMTDEEESLVLPPIKEALGFRPDPATLKPTAPSQPVHTDPAPRRSVNDEAEGTRRSLNDATTRGRLVFSLNDRFRFRRSLFKGDDAQFTAALGEVAALENYYEAEDYFYGTLQWSPDNQEVVDFMHIIQRYFES